MTAEGIGISVPRGLEADRPPEARGVRRDGVRLMVTTPGEDRHLRFDRLPEVLRDGDLLVVNESATLPASLPARGEPGRFLIDLSTQYGPDLWLVEPRWSAARPGPVPLVPGASIWVGGLHATVGREYPGIPRLRFLRFTGDVDRALETHGRPIRYGYLSREVRLPDYQTVFARVPGSAEMPSAGRPFTPRLLRLLRDERIEVASILLHAGVSSLEDGDAVGGGSPVYPEPFEVPRSTVAAILAARRRGGRVVAVGTTVVRALESAVDERGLRPARGFTRVFLSPDHPVQTVDALLTGFHAARTTHLALLAGFAGEAIVRRSYRAAIEAGYLWHEFGDSQLLWARARGAGS